MGTTLFSISSDFAELFDRFEEINAYEPDTNADGNYIDAAGEIIPDVVAYRESMLQAWIDTLTGIDDEFAIKAEQVALYIKQCNATAEIIDAEIKTLKARSAAHKRAAERLECYLKDCMNRVHLAKIDRPLARVTLRNNAESVVIDDEKQFIEWAQSTGNDCYLKYESPTIRKATLKEVLKKGDKIPFASLTKTQSIIIK